MATPDHEVQNFGSTTKHSGHTSVFSSAPPKIESGSTKLLQQLLRSGQKGLQIYKLEPTVAAPRPTRRGLDFSTPAKQGLSSPKSHNSGAKAANKISLVHAVASQDRENIHPNTPPMSRENSGETPDDRKENHEENTFRPVFPRESGQELQITAAELVYDTAASDAGSQDFDTGIFWKVKNNKYIVVNFGAGSVARRVGVRPGDILRSVDGVDILGFQADEQGHHPADDLLLGSKGSLCALKFLRVAQPNPSAVKRDGAQLVEFSVTLKRNSFVDDGSDGEWETLHKPRMHVTPFAQ